jgi:prenylcysteine oxidase/farnesylcysteine lyase
LLLKKVRGQVVKLYQEEQKNPADFGELLESAGLDKWYKTSFLEEIIKRGASQAFINEVITPLTRVIYSQNANLGGFAGLSALIGVYSGPRYRLADGNDRLPIHLANASKAAVKLDQKVNRIEKTSKGTYVLTSKTETQVFDNVILATPLEFADIEFNGLHMHNWAPQPYQNVYIRVMQGILNPTYFGIKKSADIPSIILTTKDADPITHLGIKKASNGESLVTISSTKPLDTNIFNGIFKSNAVTILEHYWKSAYPIFKPITKLPSTRIEKRFMYVNAVEPSVSSMETSALSALNAIRLLAKEH